MKIKKIIKFLILIIFLSCENSDNQHYNNWIKISEKLKYTEQEGKFLLRSGKFRYELDENKIPFRKIMIFNTTLLGYILELEEEYRIVGIVDYQYIYSEKIKRLVKLGKIKEVGTDKKYNLEKILALKPDAIFTNYIATFENTYDILRKNGIEIIFLDEYLEHNPLEKAAYLKLLGKLLKVEQKADKIYNDIEANYNKLKEKTNGINKNPKVLVGEMYGNHWFMAGGNTFIAHYLKDARADYLLKNNRDEKAIPMSFEEVLARAQNVEFWTNIGNYKTKNELLAVNPSYKKLSVFQKGKLYSFTRRQKGDANDFFESGSVRVDLVLRDYIKIFHPNLFTEDSLVYMREIK